MTNRCVTKVFDYTKGKEVRCKRPIGLSERDKGFKTCATCGERIAKKNATRDYVQNHSYALPMTKPYLKEAYATNEYGEPMHFDTEWINHEDCGRVKILPYMGGIFMLDEQGEAMVTSLGEMRRMLNLLFDAGAIRELGMPIPDMIEQNNEQVVKMGTKA